MDENSPVIREAVRRWKVCEHGPDATCQQTTPTYPREWCDACVVRALIGATVDVINARPMRMSRPPVIMRSMIAVGSPASSAR